MPHPNEVYGERESGNIIVLREYQGGWNVSGSGYWSADYYARNSADWKQILAEGENNLLKRILVSEQELEYYYQLLK